MMYAVLQWNHGDSIEKRPLVAAENRTYEQAEVIAGMNKALYERQIITMEELADMRYEEHD